MAKIAFTGLESYLKQLEKLEQNTTDIAKQAVYEGAKVTADAIRSGIEGLRTDGPSAYETKRRENQKKGLQESFGISPMETDGGFRNVKLGFDGYNAVRTPKYPNGQPNVMVARIFFSSKQPFFDNAIRLTRNRAKKIMKETIEGAIEEKMKE